jgi:uncharacterized protein (DUF1778 family)
MIKNSSEKLTKRVTFRLTNSENDQLAKTAQLLGCKTSDALRIALTSVNLAANELEKAI